MRQRSIYQIETLEARCLLADPSVALVWPITPEDRLDVGQDYAQRNWGNATKHHAGVDISAAEGTIVRAAGGGIVRRMPMTPGVYNGDNNCMGNVVIIDHSFGESSDGPFTLYGQLQTIDIADGARVFSGQQIGKVGRTPTISRPGCAAPSAPALHFEVKRRGVLGNLTDNGPELRYTPNHPDQYGYFDPLAALTAASTVEPQNATPIPPTRVTATAALNIRLGPGNYRVLKSSVAGQAFTAIRESPPTTSPTCPDGWYQVRNTNGSYFADPARAGSTVPDGWMCKGNGTDVWLVPDAAAPDVTGINPLKPRALGTAQPLVINGTNFSPTATVNLYDVTHGVSYLNRTVGSRAGTTQIVINPNFGSSVATWRVEVVNTDGRKDSFTFSVIVQAKKAVPKPAMQWVASPYFSSRAGTTVDSVVIHTVEGSYQSAINLFSGVNPNPNAVSAHFVISPAGAITQMVELSNRAHHATYYNSRSIGIEMAGFAHQASTWTPQNMAALEKVVAWVVSQYPIAVIHPPADARDYAGCRYNAAGLVSHMQVQPNACTTFATKTDPGPYFDWAKFVAGVNDRVYTSPGDANRDGLINVEDYLRIDRGTARGRSGFGNGDFNFDDVINGSDYFIIDQAYLAARSGPAAASSSASTGSFSTVPRALQEQDDEDEEESQPHDDVWA